MQVKVLVLLIVLVTIVHEARAFISNRKLNNNFFLKIYLLPPNKIWSFGEKIFELKILYT